MLGIELNKPILYKHSSLRFFNEGEHHLSRFCKDDVLLMVYDGVLRFSEAGVQYEIHPGEYHIQKHDTWQAGELPSDAPKYLYIHFLADWEGDDTVLPRSGVFEYAKLKADMEEMDRLAYSDAPYIVQAGKLYELLSKLYVSRHKDSIANQIADYIAREIPGKINLDIICKEFHFSKNYVIQLLKKETGMTPITYMNHLRIQNAEYLMGVTSNSLEDIAVQCGFQNYSHFYRLFYRKHGLSPEQWRERKWIG